MKRRSLLLLLTGVAASTALADFTPGRVVVLHCAGTSTTGNSGTLEEYDPANPGMVTLSVALPSTGGNSIVFGSSSSLNHGISRSADGALIVIPGYANMYANVDSTSGANSPRVIAAVKYDGTCARPISSTTIFSTATMRSSTSDGFDFWGMGGAGGTIYMGPGTPATVQGTTGRAVAIASGNLCYTLSGGIYQCAGIPTTPNDGTRIIVATDMGGSGTPQPAGFAISPDGTIAYLADYSGNNGIGRFNWNSGAWVFAYKMTFSEKPVHLAVDFNQSSPVLYVVSTVGSKVYGITDPGVGGAVTPAVIATATTGIFRGVAMAPAKSALPVFTVHPAGVTNNYGATVQVGPVAAMGANPYGFTWKFNSTTLTNGNNGTTATFSGADTPTLTIANITSANRGNYYAVASNNGGGVTSNPAFLELNGSCISPQLAPLAKAVGSTAVFDAGVSGCQSPLAYAWSYTYPAGGTILLANGSGPSGVSTVSGADTATLTLGNVQEADTGTYTITVTDGLGKDSISSAALTVVATPSIYAQPMTLDQAAGSTAVFTVGASGGLLSYQWYRDGSPLANGTTPAHSIIAGATSPTLAITNVQGADAGTYTVTVTNIANSATSDPATLTVGYAPVIVLPPADVFAQAGSNAVFHVVTSGTEPLTYSWRFNGGPIYDDGYHIFGALTDTLTVDTISAADLGSYTVTINNNYGSASASAGIFFLMAAPKPNTVPGQIIHETFEYPTGPFPASGSYSWDHLVTIYNQLTGEPAYWSKLGGLYAQVSANDFANYNNVTREGLYPWPGVDCNSPNHWYWSSAANNNHLVFGGVDQTNGAVYFSCLLHIDQGTNLNSGDFDTIAGLTSDSTANSYHYKLCTQVSVGGDAYWLGVFKGNGTIINSASVNGQWVMNKELHRGGLHFIVGCYKFVSGTNLVSGSLTNDDIVSLWIDPDRSTFGASEANVPPPDAGGMVTNWWVNAPIRDFGLRGSVPPASKRMTDLRIGKTWASVTQPYYPTLARASNSTDFTVGWPAKDTPLDPYFGVYHGYLLQKSPDLTTWTTVPAPYALDGTGTNNTVTEAIGSSQFYRLVQPPR